MCIGLEIWMWAGLAGWGALALLARELSGGPRENAEWMMAWVLVRAYSRLVHRVRIEGREHIPKWKEGDPPPGPLVIVSNHTGGVDPVLIHSACAFDIRWMMTREMMMPTFGRLWAWMEIIPVEQDGRDAASLRAAIRDLRAGGVVGIFAEGGLERPARQIMPYQPGVGLIVLRGKARVLPVVIDGTPTAERAYMSLLMPSRARVRFLPVREYGESGLGAPEIARELEEEAARELGWERAGVGHGHRER
jgi:1-acyl-sn-glycerol-3-phosphate acyltransferase